MLLHGRAVDLLYPDESCQHTTFVELFLDDCYRLDVIRKASHVESVLDIGANVGMFAAAARAAFPDAQIHAYEPNPTLQPYLRHQAEQCAFIAFPCAIGSAAARVHLEVIAGQSVRSATRDDLHGDIEQTSLAQAIDRLGGTVDLVKMDCEGAEWDILGDRESWSRVQNVTMEYHLQGGDDHDRIVRVLRSLGFVVISHLPIADFGLVLARR